MKKILVRDIQIGQYIYMPFLDEKVVTLKGITHNLPDHKVTLSYRCGFWGSQEARFDCEWDSRICVLDADEITEYAQVELVYNQSMRPTFCKRIDVQFNSATDKINFKYFYDEKRYQEYYQRIAAEEAARQAASNRRLRVGELINYLEQFDKDKVIYFTDPYTGDWDSMDKNYLKDLIRVK